MHASRNFTWKESDVFHCRSNRGTHEVGNIFFFTHRLLLVPLELCHFLKEHVDVFGLIDFLILREVPILN